MRVNRRYDALRKRLDDESGATAVMLVVLLVLIIGILALSIDGGLLWTKYRRVRNANDAASLAAAYSCATGLGLADANLMADRVAQSNVAGAATVPPPEYSSPICDPNGGTVTVHYRSSQVLMFGPAVRVSSPKLVVGKATAVWGGAGGSKDVIPLMVMKGRLSTCNVVPQPGKPTPPVGTECGFWFSSKALGSSSWGLLNLDIDSWATTSAPSGCNAGHSDLAGIIRNGLSSPLLLKQPPPTYVCAKNGDAIQPIDNAIEDALNSGRTDFAMPVNDPSLEVDTCSGSTCEPYKYAIIGFAFLRPSQIYDSNKKSDEVGFSKCAGAIPLGADTKNSFCLVASWQGYSSEGLNPRGGPNFGLTAIGLQQ